MAGKEWRVHNPSGRKRVIVTKELPGNRWLEILTQADCSVEICMSTDILSAEEIKVAIADRCDGAIGQLTETWGKELFTALKSAGAKAYSNYAVGFNNVDIDSATRVGIPVGNTPGVLSDTTAELAVALTFSAGRRIGEGERFLRAGLFKGWLPTLFLGKLFKRQTVGIIGAGRIGSTYARIMVEAARMNLIYYDLHPNKALEEYIDAYGRFLMSQGERAVSCKRAQNVDEVLREADVVSLHPVLNETTHHLINAQRLALMREDAILINASRGPVIDEAALVAHCQAHPNFRAGLDVFEDEPQMKPGLAELGNVVIVPHVGSATVWTRSGMATLAATNVASIVLGYPVWRSEDISPFLGDNPPKAAPSIVNAKELGLPLYSNQL